ncbi:MAG: subtype B tannase [Propionibacteriaceae bacterium]
MELPRRTLLAGFAGIAATSLVGCSTTSSSSSSASSTATGSARATAVPSSLAFDPTKFTQKTVSVATGSGTKSVTYNYYALIPYVMKPVDTTYQSLNVSVPISIDGVAIDASNAPILLSIGVAGYLSVAASGGSSLGGGGGAMPTGSMPTGGAVPTGAKSGTGGGTAGASTADLALAAGYVVVAPGCRGRDNVDNSGTYFGKAPAAIVDLKAAVRYIRANKGVLPGNTDWIISSGTSAGGALSSLLGASGGSSLYDSYLTALGAADASDAIFAVGSWCPITDLEHADMAYEWYLGSNAYNGSTVDQTASAALRSSFSAYQQSLGLAGKSGFGAVTADTFGAYLLKTYLVPSATSYLAGLSDSARATYLSGASGITYSSSGSDFTFANFLTHVGARKKSIPAFDAFDLSAGENSLFGTTTTAARHFTDDSNQHANGSSATLDADIASLITLMNPMYFLAQQNAARAKNWWLRVGTSDTDTSLTVLANLALKAENLGDSVNAAMYWDGAHGANNDPDAFIGWIKATTGYTP